jgi:hypothetical protein
MLENKSKSVYRQSGKWLYKLSMHTNRVFYETCFNEAGNDSDKVNFDDWKIVSRHSERFIHIYKKLKLTYNVELLYNEYKKSELIDVCEFKN